MPWLSPTRKPKQAETQPADDAILGQAEIVLEVHVAADHAVAAVDARIGIAVGLIGTGGYIDAVEGERLLGPGGRCEHGEQRGRQ